MAAIQGIAEEGDVQKGKEFKKEAYLMMFENSFFDKAFSRATRQQARANELLDLLIQ